MAQAGFEDLVETFEFLDDWEERYRHVIELGKASEHWCMSRSYRPFRQDLQRSLASHPAPCPSVLLLQALG